jgi:hypothetical protein
LVHLQSLLKITPKCLWIGHIANDKDSLQDMVNLDLAYLKDWSKRWLVKFNQNKTEIMVFSSRDTKLYLPQTIRAASVCTFSKRFELKWPQLNQTSDAYSKIGLINVKYIL